MPEEIPLIVYKIHAMFYYMENQFDGPVIIFKALQFLRKTFWKWENAQ
jgi:hypothetical protein